MDRVWQRPGVRYLAVAAGIAYLFYLAFMRPYTFGTRNMSLALGLIAIGFLAAGFETYFLSVLLAVFFVAGSNLPLSGIMQQVRWAALGVAGVLSIAYYARHGRNLPFTYLHLLGAVSAAGAFVSALVSYNPLLTIMKSLSLVALFVYASLGTRLLWYQQPGRLSRDLTRFVEVMVYLTAACYFLARFEIWGNSNSLGLIVGVACWPVSLWRFLLSRTNSERTSRGLVLVLCASLLFVSGARAAMLGGAISSVLLLMCARRPRPLLVGGALLCVFLAGAYVLSPERFQGTSEKLIYKGADRYKGVLLSRQDPWNQSIESFQAHPWLGTGYGVSQESADWRGGYEASSLTRERGSSYLRMLEGTGLLGSIPMAALFLGFLHRAGRAFSRLYMTKELEHPSVPVACIVVASLSHAFFEDWLVAVGYYMSVIFWVLAFSLPDLTHARTRH